ncbi:MAG: hypothetical protein EZS28_001796 [Streblomastix strix]|uniref:TFIIS central domain-containing protein n=1 Tax=Streblomastix strix TaxID=222440 RepID=A0A5J4X827_9EUKA|nr:MAG: hypothetical protein EZS28_001796 [Streblomastix strix]
MKKNIERSDQSDPFIEDEKDSLSSFLSELENDQPQDIYNQDFDDISYQNDLYLGKRVRKPVQDDQFIFGEQIDSISRERRSKPQNSRSQNNQITSRQNKPPRILQAEINQEQAMCDNVIKAMQNVLAQAFDRAVQYVENLQNNTSSNTETGFDNATLRKISAIIIQQSQSSPEKKQQDLKSLAESIERGMLNICQSALSATYKEKYRQIRFNLGDEKNKTFRLTVFGNLIRGEDIAKLDSWQMASADMVKTRMAIEEQGTLRTIKRDEDDINTTLLMGEDEASKRTESDNENNKRQDIVDNKSKEITKKKKQQVKSSVSSQPRKEINQSTTKQYHVENGKEQKSTISHTQVPLEEVSVMDLIKPEISTQDSRRNKLITSEQIVQDQHRNPQQLTNDIQTRGKQVLQQRRYTFTYSQPFISLRLGLPILKPVTIQLRKIMGQFEQQNQFPRQAQLLETRETDLILQTLADQFTAKESTFKCSLILVECQDRADTRRFKAICEYLGQHNLCSEIMFRGAAISEAQQPPKINSDRLYLAPPFLFPSLPSQIRAFLQTEAASLTMTNGINSLYPLSMLGIYFYNQG